MGGDDGGDVSGNDNFATHVNISSDTSRFPSVEAVSNFMSGIQKSDSDSASDGTDVYLVTLDEYDLVEVE